MRHPYEVHEASTGHRSWRSNATVMDRDAPVEVLAAEDGNHVIARLVPRAAVVHLAITVQQNA